MVQGDEVHKISADLHFLFSSRLGTACLTTKTNPRMFPRPSSTRASLFLQKQTPYHPEQTTNNATSPMTRTQRTFWTYFPTSLLADPNSMGLRSGTWVPCSRRSYLINRIWDNINESHRKKRLSESNSHSAQDHSSNHAWQGCCWYGENGVRENSIFCSPDDRETENAFCKGTISLSNVD